MPNKPKTIDKIIFAFLVIFAATLTNSIFLNQLGYYGALFFLLVKWAQEKKNPFAKTGLEVYFLLFLLAELLSAIFSVEPGHAFHNFTKRLLLIPTVYVIASVVYNPKRISKIFYTFLFFAILSSVIYLWNSYSFYIRGLFQLTGSGPFLFHYPITTSELFSFSTLILAAFVIKKDLTPKKRMLYLIGFLISALSLIATFKRTGWIGLAAGLIMMIIIKRKFIYLIPFAIGVLFLIFTQRSISSVEIYKIGDSIKKISTIDTKGAVSGLSVDDVNVYISDYDRGLEKLSDSLESMIQFDSPVVDFKHWEDDYFIARLVNTKFVLVGKDRYGEFSRLEEFMTKGMTKDFTVCKSKVFVVDIDSGVTIFNSPTNLKDTVELRNLNDYYQVDCCNGNVFLFSKKLGVGRLSYSDGRYDFTKTKFTKKILSLNVVDDFLLIQKKNKIFKVTPSMEILDSSDKKLPEIMDAINTPYGLLAFTQGGEIYKFDSSLAQLNKIGELGFNPKSVIVKGDSLIVAHLKTSRIASIFNPYLPANANRIALWRAGINMFLDHPILGVGDIDLAKLYRQYKRPEDKEIQGHLHNNYFHFIAIGGVVGFVSVMLLLIKIFLFLLNVVKKFQPDSFEHTLALGFIGVFVSFIISGLTEWNFGDHEIITFIWFVVGMSISLKRSKEI